MLPIVEEAQMKSSSLGFQSVKVIALAASDVARAKRFYSETLQLEEDCEATDEVGYRIGHSVLIIREHPPTDDPNPRITLQVEDARETEKQLKERAVTISDPVKLYEDKFWVGGFLDSEGNKLWFCSYA
jgi:predicted enzyme related to lactoylglutathione lyase